MPQETPTGRHEPFQALGEQLDRVALRGRRGAYSVHGVGAGGSEADGPPAGFDRSRYRR